MRPVLPLVVCAALAGCAATGVVRPGLTVAPVSLMGDHLALRDVGMSILRDDRRDIDVAHWQIDQHAEAVAGKVVGHTGKFRVAQADTAPLRKSVRLKEDPWTGGTRMLPASGSLAAFAKDSAADYVLLIGPASMGDPFLGTDEQLSGYGIYQRSLRITQPALIGLKRAFSFLAMKVLLLDARSGAAVARAEIETLVEAALRKCLGTLKLA